mmetsp:Transcript_57653/g.140810  ORF Transcript_57653/g.140810 Transcript_57653/m.140810 type:complete len:94 (+) Transcript_57653:1185-1466(+)
MICSRTFFLWWFFPGRSAAGLCSQTKNENASSSFKFSSSFPLDQYDIVRSQHGIFAFRPYQTLIFGGRVTFTLQQLLGGYDFRLDKALGNVTM